MFHIFAKTSKDRNFLISIKNLFLFLQLHYVKINFLIQQFKTLSSYFVMIKIIRHHLKCEFSYFQKQLSKHFSLL